MRRARFTILHIVLAAILLIAVASVSQAGLWQYSATVDSVVTAIIPKDDPRLAKSQPAMVRIVRNTTGAENVITFPRIAGVTDMRKAIKLGASASSGMPVAYYVDSGPAIIDGDTLKFTPIPPRSKSNQPIPL
ncbi:MAG: hypothetical protein P4L33_07850 [Capsulimonadaceae bacterium]|nr:hypothetical protein [Capsulimonadaceae bacterium]